MRSGVDVDVLPLVGEIYTCADLLFGRGGLHFDLLSDRLPLLSPFIDLCLPLFRRFLAVGIEASSAAGGDGIDAGHRMSIALFELLRSLKVNKKAPSSGPSSVTRSQHCVVERPSGLIIVVPCEARLTTMGSSPGNRVRVGKMMNGQSTLRLRDPANAGSETEVISLVRRCSIRRFSYGYLVTTYSQSVVSPWFRLLRVTELRVPLPSMS